MFQISDQYHYCYTGKHSIISVMNLIESYQSFHTTVKLKEIDLISLTLSHILDSSKLKEFADDNFNFDEYERKLIKRVENTVGKGEIARYEQFLLFPQCFQ